MNKKLRIIVPAALVAAGLVWLAVGPVETASARTGVSISVGTDYGFFSIGTQHYHPPVVVAPAPVVVAPRPVVVVPAPVVVPARPHYYSYPGYHAPPRPHHHHHHVAPPPPKHQHDPHHRHTPPAPVRVPRR